MSKMMLQKMRQYVRQGRRMSVVTALAKARREFALMKKVDHPNLVHCYEIIDDQDEDDMFLGTATPPSPSCTVTGYCDCD